MIEYTFGHQMMPLHSRVKIQVGTCTIIIAYQFIEILTAFNDNPVYLNPDDNVITIEPPPDDGNI